MYTSAQATANLRALGFRGTFDQMLGSFQRGWNLGPALVVDRLYGPKSDAALATSMRARAAGQGTMSAHFSFTEFQCRCGGLPGCLGVWTLRTHVARLEAARAKVGPIHIVSGCRCPAYNRRVGGAANSQHMYGSASDVAFPDRRVVASWRLFAGIGYKGATGKVLHVDSRDVSGVNSTHGSTTSPTTWVYA